MASGGRGNESPAAAASSAYRDDVEGESDQEDFVPYAERPEWSDVLPLPQVSLPAKILVIDYSPQFLDCFNYFRAVLQSGEKSERVLELTADAIELNAANYTVWQYRRDVLQALNIPSAFTKEGPSPAFAREFAYTRDSVDYNQKNYQVWHHRKILVQWAGLYNDESERMELECAEGRARLLKEELDLTVRLIGKDAKNYHAWQHRQWILCAFNTYDEELDFVDKLLLEDVRNNSAWNHRHFVITKIGDVRAAVVKKEAAYTWAHIQKAPSNESPWSYLLGLLRLNPEVSLANCDDILHLCEELQGQNIRSPPMFSFMLSAYEERLGGGMPKEEPCRRAIEICETLATSVDKIRRSYWTFMKGRFQAQLEQAKDNVDD